MKKIKKLVSAFLAVCILSSLAVITASADRAVISAEKTQAIGNTFNVTIRYEASSLGSLDATVTYDASVLECVSLPAGTSKPSNGQILISYFAASPNETTCSFNFSFKAIATGSCTISTTGEITSFDLSSGSTQSSSVKITVPEKAALSSNANLKMLYLSNNIPLNPAFNKDITTYNITVDNSITKVLVNVWSEDAAAKISVQGSANMKVGANVRTVIVTAPDGTQKKYTLNINRLAPQGDIPETPEGETPNTEENPTINPYEVTINGSIWILDNEYLPEEILPSFSLSSTVVNSVEIPAIKNSANGKVVVLAKAADGSKTSYYEYDAVTGKFSEYRIFSTSAQNYVFLNLDSNLVVPKGYYLTTANIGGFNIDVVKYEDAAFADYLIFYAQHGETEKSYYRYDTVNGTVQRIPEFDIAIKNAALLANSTFSSRFAALSTMDKLMIGAVLLTAILVIVLIILTIVRLVKFSRKPIDELDEFDDLEDFDDEYENLDEFEELPEEDIEEDIEEEF